MLILVSLPDFPKLSHAVREELDGKRPELWLRRRVLYPDSVVGDKVDARSWRLFCKSQEKSRTSASKIAFPNQSCYLMCLFPKEPHSEKKYWKS